MLLFITDNNSVNGETTSYSYRKPSINTAKRGIIKMNRSVDRQLELAPLSGSELPSPEKIANKTSDTSSKHGFASTVAARWRSVRNITTIEPLLAFYIVPVVIVNFAVQNLNLDKACRVNLNYSHEVCDALARRDMANYTLEEQEIQKLVAGMITWKSILQSGLPGFMILFWGSWSDRYGFGSLMLVTSPSKGYISLFAPL